MYFKLELESKIGCPIDIEAKGLKAVGLSKIFGETDNSINIASGIVISFSLDEVMHNNYLKKIFAEKNKCSIYVPKGFLNDEVGKNIIFNLQKEMFILDKLKIFNKLIEDIKKNAVGQYSTDNPDSNDFCSKSIYYGDTELEKDIIDIIFKPKEIEKILVNEDRKLTCKADENLFPNHRYVIFYIMDGNPSILWDDGCNPKTPSEIRRKVEQIKDKYLGSRYCNKYSVGINYLLKIKELLTDEMVSEKIKEAESYKVSLHFIDKWIEENPDKMEQYNARQLSFEDTKEE